MDDKLLQRRGATGIVGENNQPDTPEVETEIETEAEPKQFRDLAVEAPSPPIRMRLQPPVEYDGKSYEEIICDFDSMIGKDFQRCEREFQRMYKADRNETPLPEMKHLYHAIVISHAANVPLGLIFKLPRRYYTPIRLEALKACGSSPDVENP